MAQPKSICVYCASSNRVDESYNSAAHKLGALLAREGITLVTGGGSIGLMRSVEDGALENGGKAIGVIPQFMVEQGWHHTGLSELRITTDMHTRKQTMAQLSDAVIALPGGCGTMEEFARLSPGNSWGSILTPS